MNTSRLDGGGYSKDRIPTSQQMYKPILLCLAEEECCSFRKIYDYTETYFNLSKADLLFTTDNGKRPLFYLRFNLALHALNEKCLLLRLYRGMYGFSSLGEWCVEQYVNQELVDISWIPNFMIDRYGRRCPIIIAENRYLTFVKSLSLYKDAASELFDNCIYQDTGYAVSIEELYEIYKVDADFRNILKSGRYVYVEGYISRAHLRIDECEEEQILTWISYRYEEEYLGFVKNKSTGSIRYSGIVRKRRLRNPYISYNKKEVIAAE